MKSIDRIRSLVRGWAGPDQGEAWEAAERLELARSTRSTPKTTARFTSRSGARMYANAKSSRLTNGWNAPDNSADSELISSLRVLRGRSRALVRDAPYAKRAKVVVVNNVIGTGIGMQAQVKNRNGKLIVEVNAAIEAAWHEWCEAENCHTGGRLHFADLERQLMGQVF
jgi:capsid protein